MGSKNKLKRFSENLTFKNVIQPERDVIVNNNFKFKGNWNKLIFKNKNPIVVELGCGKGEYSVALAKENPEINYIENCANYFGLTKTQYESIKTLWLDKQINPYKVLGVNKEATNGEIRKRWIELSKELHPDQLSAQGVPQELIIKSEDRLSEINQAYDKIKILRNIN